MRASSPRGKLIALTGTQLELSNTTETVTITGPAAGLTISGGAIELTTAGSDSGFPVSSSDLLQTNLSSSSVTGNIGDQEGLNTAADIAALSNGQFGPAAPINPPGPNPEVVLIHDGVEITYNLDTGTHPLGYDLTNINTYAGWGDSGRSQQDYTVSYSTVTDPNTFHELDTVFAPSYDGRPSDTAAFLSGSSGILASNVASIIFSFPSTQNGYVGYRELDVLGLPSTALVPPFAGPSRVFQVDAGVTASISGLTITGGSTGGNGGGVLNYGTTTLTDCTLSGNSAEGYGGGLANFGTATLTDCTVSGNSSGNIGGGVYNGGTLTLINSTLDGNKSGRYGSGLGIGNGATATLTGCTVSGNSNIGLFNYGGTATLTDCTISGNGGGLINGSGSTMTLTDCTVSGNFRFALRNNGTATLTNSTLSGNAGYGLINNGTATLTDCTVSGNSNRGVEARSGIHDHADRLHRQRQLRQWPERPEWRHGHADRLHHQRQYRKQRRRRPVHLRHGHADQLHHQQQHRPGQRQQPGRRWPGDLPPRQGHADQLHHQRQHRPPPGRRRPVQRSWHGDAGQHDRRREHRRPES